MTKPRRVFQQLFLFWQEVEKTPVLLSIYRIFLSIKGQKAFSPESHSESERGAVKITVGFLYTHHQNQITSYIYTRS